jgi:hypothetical protein
MNQSYREYLNSDEWRIKREIILDRAERMCQLCGSTERLNVHHRSYKRLRTPEEHRDLIVLCNSCHAAFHAKADEGWFKAFLGCVTAYYWASNLHVQDGFPYADTDCILSEIRKFLEASVARLSKEQMSNYLEFLGEEGHFWWPIEQREAYFTRASGVVVDKYGIGNEKCSWGPLSDDPLTYQVSNNNG